MIERPKDRELVTSRLIDGPRERVYGAFSDPARLTRWWGPRGFTNTFQEFDLRPGGRWHFVMRGPDGAEFPNESVFVEITPPERVVFKHVSKPKFEMTITFAEHEGRTRVGWRQVFDTAAERDRVAKFAVEANEQNLDRLAWNLREAEGWHSITPRIFVQDVGPFVAFLRSAFGATGELLAEAPSLIGIGDSLLMVSVPGARDQFPAFLYVYVEDVDTTYKRALDAGAVSLEEVWDTPYGDRRGMVKDSWGNVWQVATPRRLT